MNDLQMDPVPAAPLGIVALPGCEEMAEKLNQHLTHWREDLYHDERLHCRYGHRQSSFLIQADLCRFSSGEGKAVLQESVRGVDLFILADITAHSRTYDLWGSPNRMSPDDHFANLKRVISAASGRAYRITVVMPMLYEGRQHRRTARESMDCAMMLQELVSMGVNSIVTFDAHDPNVQNVIPYAGFENIMPTYDMLSAVLQAVPDLRLDDEHLIVVAPDEGAMRRNLYYRAAMGVGIGTFWKNRDYSRMVNGTNPIIAHEYMGGSVQGKDVFVADDMIASGGSVLDLAEQLKSRGAQRIYVAATFGLFTSGLEKFDKAFEEGLLSGIFSTDLTWLPPELLARPWFHAVPMSRTLSIVISALNHNESVQMSADLWKYVKELVENTGKAE